VHDRPAVVDARDVGGGEDGGHAGLDAQALDVDGDQTAVGHRRQAERAVQRALEFADVVGVGRLSGHVQVRRLMCAIAPDLRQRLDEEAFGLPVHGVAPSRANTDTWCGASGAVGRVSSQKRRSRFAAARWRYDAPARRSVIGV